MDEKQIETANEPVDHQDDEFMDTGVLYEPCTDKSCTREHPHPKPREAQ